MTTLSLSSAEKLELVTIVKNFNVSKDIPQELQDNANAIQYVGYDPVYLLQVFWQRGIAKPLAKKEVQADMVMCCIVAGERGNPREDTLAKTSDAGIAIIRNLINTYQIPIKADNKAPKIKLERDTLTFTRIAQALPLVTCKLLLEGICNPTPLKRERFNVTQLPLSMQTAAFSSMVKLAEGFNYIKNGRIIRLAGIAWALEFNQTVNTTDAKANEDEIRNTILPKVARFFDLGLGYQLFEMKRATELLTKYGITNGTVLNPNIVKVAYDFNAHYQLDTEITWDVKVSDGFVTYCNEVLSNKSMKDKVLNTTVVRDFTP